MVAEREQTWTDEALVFRVQEAVEDLLCRMEGPMRYERKRYRGMADEQEMAQEQRKAVMYSVFHFKRGGKTFQSYCKLVMDSKVKNYLENRNLRRCDELDRKALSLEDHEATRRAAGYLSGQIDQIRQVEDRDELARLLSGMPDEFWELFAELAEQWEAREQGTGKMIERKREMVRLQGVLL